MSDSVNNQHSDYSGWGESSVKRTAQYMNKETLHLLKTTYVRNEMVYEGLRNKTFDKVGIEALVRDQPP